MPTPYSFGAVSTSTAVTTTARSDGFFGMPFIVTHTFGAIVANPAVPVATQGTSALVNLVACTAALPNA